MQIWKYLLKNQALEVSNIKEVREITPLHNIREIQKAISNNIYAKAAIDDITETAFSKGLSASKVINSDQLQKAGKDYIKYGNSFLEVVFFGKKPVAIWHIFPDTISIVKVVQFGNYPVKIFRQGKSKKTYEELTPHVFERKNTGKRSYILHFQNYEDDPYYGAPYWLAALPKIKQLAYADNFISSFYENDGIPKGMLITKGQDIDDDASEEIAEELESNRGSHNRRTLLHIHMDEGSDAKYLAFNENIVDEAFIKLLERTSVSICAAFRIPPKRVGIETAGKLGGGNEYQYQLAGYYSDVIIPIQQYFEKSLLIIEKIQLQRPPIIAIKGDIGKEEKLDALSLMRKDLLDYGY